MNFVPLFWAVAALTLLAQVTAVCIVNLVAGKAGFWGVFIFLVDMAGSATGIFMVAF